MHIFQVNGRTLSVSFIFRFLIDDELNTTTFRWPSGNNPAHNRMQDPIVVTFECEGLASWALVISNISKY